ncbi:MAG: hypothetical protein GTO54_03470 [Nitrososphaeria archaeon]|nr:hypothetical protein [Nitrososphaeria archaeon]
MSILPDGVELRTPLTKKALTKLRSGDIVYISGHVWTCRSSFFIRVFEKRRKNPIDTGRYNVMITHGPSIKKVGGKWVPPKSLGGTLGFRFRKWMPKAIKRFGLRAVVSKGSLNGDVSAACREAGCVYLTLYSMPWTYEANVHCVRKIVESHWLEFGSSDAVWVFEVEKCGPYIVNIDMVGNVYYEEITEKIKGKAEKLYEELGIADFRYTFE